MSDIQLTRLLCEQTRARFDQRYKIGRIWQPLTVRGVSTKIWHLETPSKPRGAQKQILKKALILFLEVKILNSDFIFTVGSLQCCGRSLLKLSEREDDPHTEPLPELSQISHFLGAK